MKALKFPGAVVLLAAAWALALPAPLSAQGYPNKSVRLVVPFAPGGATDIQARVISKELGEQFGQSFVVDNRAGASGMIGAEAVVSSPADGYTILFTTAALAINATLSKSTLKFDPVKDLAPVIWTSSTPLVLIVHPGVAAKSAEELIELARKNPTRLNVALTVSGSTSHMAAEMFRQLAGISFTNVPYKGGAPAMLAMVSGEVDFLFAEALLAAPQIKAGKVRALAVTTVTAVPGVSRSANAECAAARVRRGQLVCHLCPCGNAQGDRRDTQYRDPKGAGDEGGARPVRAGRIDLRGEHA